MVRRECRRGCAESERRDGEECGERREEVGREGEEEGATMEEGAMMLA